MERLLAKIENTTAILKQIPSGQGRLIVVNNFRKWNKDEEATFKSYELDEIVDVVMDEEDNMYKACVVRHVAESKQSIIVRR